MSDISDRRTDLPPRAIGVPDTGQGLFQKFEVRRADGSSEPGGKHEGCEYFVLDTDHDPFAPAALRAYADACEATHPLLARDLRERYPLGQREERTYVLVPILERFDQTKPIGWVKVLRAALPPTYSWCFSLGVLIDKTGYRLESVSITSDDEYERVIDREKGRLLTDPTEHVVRSMRERAVGIARDIADAFAKERNDGNSSAALFRHLADHLLAEPELVRTIAAWHAAALHQVDGGQPQAAQPRGWWKCGPEGEIAMKPAFGLVGEGELMKAEGWLPMYDGATPPTEPAPISRTVADTPGMPGCKDITTRYKIAQPAPQAEPATRPAWEDASARERTHARSLLARHCSLELRATLSAHQEEWWRLNREREASEADILQVLAAGLSASRVEPNRRPASGMVLSQEKRRTACISPILLRETGRWAGGTHDEYGGWTFSPEAWDKFTTSLSEDPPLELMTSPGVSAPESVLHPSCITRGCQEALVCPQGKCAKGRGQEAGR